MSEQHKEYILQLLNERRTENFSIIQDPDTDSDDIPDLVDELTIIDEIIPTLI